TPPSYARNKPLPAAAPDYVRTFSTTDWGSGHGEAPRFEIAFEDTYPSCATRAVKLFVEDRPGFDAFFRKAGVPPSDLPNSRWSRGISTALCHHFSLQERKCPYWQNCIFLHVETEVLMREFKRYKCMCGPNDGVCRFTRCPYAHTQTQLTIPSAFEEPAFPGEDAVREIRYTSEQTGLESTLKLPRKFIANTSQKIANSLCSHTYDWCSDAQCNHGVHITPEGWAWLRGYSDATKADLPTPRYFASKVRRVV
ncbi:unnamed protein product, partial [Effrenium voratum]